MKGREGGLGTFNRGKVAWWRRGEWGEEERKHGCFKLVTVEVCIKVNSKWFNEGRWTRLGFNIEPCPFLYAFNAPVGNTLLFLSFPIFRCLFLLSNQNTKQNKSQNKLKTKFPDSFLFLPRYHKCLTQNNHDPTLHARFLDSKTLFLNI